MESMDLTKGSVKRVLLAFAVPFFIANALQAAYGAVDLYTVGRFCGTSAVSAVNIGSQAMQIVTSFVIGIAMGTTVMIARASGEKNQEMIQKILQSSVWILIVLAAVLTVAMMLGESAIVSWMMTPAEAVAETRTYIRLCCYGILFIVIFNINAAIMRGRGDSRTPMILVGISGLINVVGYLALTGFFQMGVADVAAATAASQMVSALLSIYVLHQRKASAGRFPFPINATCMRSIFSIGLPIAMQDTLINISFMILTLVANQRGLASSSAVGIVEKLITFMFLVPSSMLSSVSAFTAQNLGAQKKDRIHSCVLFAMGLTAGFGALMCLLSWLMPQQMAAIFAKDPEVIVYAGEYLRSYSIDCILVGFTFVINGYLSGMGRSIIAFIHNTIAIFLVRIPAAFLLSAAYPASMFPMGFASPLGSCFSIAFLVIYFSYKKNTGRRQAEVQ